jgi:thiol-disulfide isomerase/thioredoxin
VPQRRKTRRIGGRQATGRLVTALSLLALSVLAGCASGPRVANDRLDFALPDLDQHEVRAADPRFAGKVLLVTLWGTWCPPCVSEIPTFNRLHATYADDGLVVVAIAFERAGDGRERQAKLTAFAAEHGIRYLVLDGGTTADFSASLPMVEGVGGLPVEILVDRTGRVADCRNGYGYSDTWAAELEARIAALLAATP